MRVAVLGAGSIGCLVAAKLVMAGHEVMVHGRGLFAANLAVNGLRIKGIWEHKISPDEWLVTLDEAGIHDELLGKYDLAIITSKAKDTETLVEIASQLTTGPVLSLQNGLGNYEIIQSYVNENSAVGVTTNAVKRSQDGSIEWVGKGNLFVGGHQGKVFEELLKPLGAKFEPDVSSILWNKLLINVAINPLAAICGVENGELRREPLLSQAEATMLEAANIARNLNIKVHDDLTLIEQLHKVLESTSQNVCSMLADIRAGNETEIDFLCGQVVLRGESLGIPTPLNSMLLSQVKSLN